MHGGSVNGTVAIQLGWHIPRDPQVSAPSNQFQIMPEYQPTTTMSYTLPLHHNSLIVVTTSPCIKPAWGYFFPIDVPTLIKAQLQYEGAQSLHRCCT